MQSATVAFRVDASSVIGNGHVKRCLSLAQAMRHCGAKACFVTRALGVEAEVGIAAAGFDCVTLPSPPVSRQIEDTVPHASWAGVRWDIDAAQTIAALRDLHIDWILIDHYSFDARWHAAVAQSLACRVAAIDDLADRAMYVDLLIDHNAAPDHRHKYEGLLEPSAVVLGGPSYALLGPSYAAAPRYQFSEKVRSIGIFLGGADLLGLSAVALAACRQAGFVGPVEIVSTSSNPALAPLAAAVKADGLATLVIDLPELSNFFARHDLHVGAGGGATWERCCIGSPTLVLITAENQINVGHPLVQYGAIELVPALPPLLDDIVTPLRRLLANAGLRRALSLRATGLVDGHGAHRAAAAMFEL